MNLGEHNSTPKMELLMFSQVEARDLLNIYDAQGSHSAKNRSAQMSFMPRLRRPGVDLSWVGHFPTELLPGKGQNNHL